MKTWRALEGEDLVLVSPVGFKLRDEFSGDSTFGFVSARLDIEDSGAWRATDIKPVKTASNVLAYPGLGRRFGVVRQQPRRYRVRVEGRYYIPHYRHEADGLEFLAPPYNDTNPATLTAVTVAAVATAMTIEVGDVSALANNDSVQIEGVEYVIVNVTDNVNPMNDTFDIPAPGVPAPGWAKDTPVRRQPKVRDLFLLPAPNYPFPPHVPVLRGVVVDGNGDPVPDVLIQEGMKDRTLTDGHGVFSLPLRWVAAGVPTQIDADDKRSGRSGMIQITLPAALGTNQKITVV